MDKSEIQAWIFRSENGIDGMLLLAGIMETLKGMLVIFVLPAFTFIVLYYKPLFLEVISELFKKREQGVVSDVLTQTKTLIQNYLVGLSIEALIVALLNSAGLLLLGIPYAILLGIITALLNVIPYIGILAATAFTMLVALAMVSPAAALAVLVLNLVIQFIDNQYIVPKIVAGKVKINAFVSIIVVFAGGSLWGIAGMFLAIPIVAIIKVVFDRVDALKPYGLLLGDTLPGENLKSNKKSRQKKAEIL